MNNNIDSITANKVRQKVVETLYSMDVRDLIALQDDLLSFSYLQSDGDTYYGISGTDYGKEFKDIISKTSRDELLKIINKRLIGKETADYLETINTPFSENIEEKKSTLRR